MRIYDLIKKDRICHADVDISRPAPRLEYDVKNCTSDCIFVIPNSEKGPSNFGEAPIAVVCSEDAILPEGIKAIRVSEPRLVISEMYSAFYNIDYSKLKIIGVTGTNGKTSTATFIKHAFYFSGIKVGFVGTGMISIGEEILSDAYYSMTTPDPWLLYPSLKKMEDAGCSVVVMEVSSHALELNKVAPLKFELAVFTNLSPEHLDFHGDMENYYLSKKKLFLQSKRAVINIDDPYGRRLARELDIPKITAGVLWRGNVFVTDIKNKGFDGIDYLYHAKTYSFLMKLKAAGIHNIYNSMLAASAAIDLGLIPCEVKRSISDLPKICGRYEIIKDDVTVIIDYAHTDIALESMLKSLTLLKQNENGITVIFGCGGERDKSKRARMARVAERYAVKTVVTTDNPRGEDEDKIIADILSGFTKQSHKTVKNREQAITETILNAQKGDVIAIIGKGAEKYTIDKSGYHSFDEHKIVFDALKTRREGKLK